MKLLPRENSTNLQRSLFWLGFWITIGSSAAWAFSGRQPCYHEYKADYKQISAVNSPGGNKIALVYAELNDGAVTGQSIKIVAKDQPFKPNTDQNMPVWESQRSFDFSITPSTQIAVDWLNEEALQISFTLSEKPFSSLQRTRAEANNTEIKLKALDGRSFVKVNND